MQRIFDATAAASLPAVPALSGTVGYFTEGVPGTTPPTLARGWWLNMVTEELYAIVVAGGVTPDTTGTVLNQVVTAIDHLIATSGVAATVGTLTVNTTLTAANRSTAYYVNNGVTVTTPTATLGGVAFSFVFATGCTLALGGGAFTGGGLTGSSLSAPAGSFITIQADGTNWRVIACSPDILGYVPGSWKTTNVSTSGTLTTANDRQFIFLTATGTTQTLPAPAAATNMSVGFMAGSVTLADGAFTLTTPSANIVGGIIDAASVTVPGTAWIFVQSDGSNWRITSASPDVVGYVPESAFGNSQAGNGYQKLPSGVIIQWFSISVATQSVHTLSFPIAFPNSCASTVGSVGTFITATSNDFGVGIQPISATQYQVVVASATSGTAGVWCMAIGY